MKNDELVFWVGLHLDHLPYDDVSVENSMSPVEKSFKLSMVVVLESVGKSNRHLLSKL